jgi:hypothetical protein
MSRRSAIDQCAAADRVNDPPPLATTHRARRAMTETKYTQNTERHSAWLVHSHTPLDSVGLASAARGRGRVAGTARKKLWPRVNRCVIQNASRLFVRSCRTLGTSPFPHL